MLSQENIWVKRPGTEIKAEFYKDVLGKIAKKDIKNGTHKLEGF